jgi:hypothetical protein
VVLIWIAHPPTFHNTSLSLPLSRPAKTPVSDDATKPRAAVVRLCDPPLPDITPESATSKQTRVYPAATKLKSFPFRSPHGRHFILESREIGWTLHKAQDRASPGLQMHSLDSAWRTPHRENVHPETVFGVRTDRGGEMETPSNSTNYVERRGAP